MEDHVHRFGAFGVARFTGNPRRECLEPGCRVVSLDNYEDEALPALAQIDGWVKWFEGYGARRFLESFLRNAHGAQSQCRYCSSAIYLDLLEGCGVADWRTVRGDYGCAAAPESDDEAVSGHLPVGVVERDDDFEAVRA
jgi:hypothetical protein